MDVREVRPRLWRWTARHPDWEKEPDAGWDPIVASHAYVAPAGDELVLIDPLAPSEAAADRFWAALEDDVAHHGAPYILLTVFWHDRSSTEILDRYGGSVWADERGRDRLDVPSPRLYRPGDTLPGGLVAHDAVGRNESLLWLEEHGALFAGDILHGDDKGGVRLCPDDWLQPGLAPADVKRELRSLLDLPIELVLTAHGAPVLENGRSALEHALEAR